MNGLRAIGLLCFGLALAAACGGSTSSENAGGTDGGASGAADSSMGGRGAGSGSSAGLGTVPNDSGMVIVTNVECPPNSNPPSLCLTGESCCSTTATPDAGGPTTTAYSCVASVASCGGQATSCTSSLQCKTSQVCCREAVGDAGGARNQVCEDAACPTNTTQLCNDTSECQTGTTCSVGGTCRVPACTGKASCSGGEVCCLGAGRGTLAACQATCAMAAAQVCQTSTECPIGQTCMGGGGGGVMTCGVPPCSGAATSPTGQYCCDMGRAGPACQGTTCAMGAQVCAATMECATGETCQAQGQGQPMICAAPPCTAGSCGAGMVCCSTGGGTCETGATCLTGVQLCTVNADCASGLVCRAAGGGALGCRAPVPDGGGASDGGGDAESLRDATGGG
jgi:hypothetical protein